MAEIERLTIRLPSDMAFAVKEAVVRGARALLSGPRARVCD